MIAVRLKIANGKFQGREVVVRNSRTILGRSKNCDIRILCSQISRQHCEFLITDGNVFLIDLAGKNGTYINAIRIPPKTQNNCLTEINCK